MTFEDIRRMTERLQEEAAYLVSVTGKGTYVSKKAHAALKQVHSAAELAVTLLGDSMWTGRPQ